MRVWDNRGGTILTWDQALASGTASLYSDLFIVPFALGGTMSPPNPPVNLQGLQSFQLAVGVPCPEPSTFALAIVSACSLALLGRRRHAAKTR